MKTVTIESMRKMIDDYAIKGLDEGKTVSEIAKEIWEKIDEQTARSTDGHYSVPHVKQIEAAIIDRYGK